MHPRQDRSAAAIAASLHAAQDAFRVALCDSFNTPVALDVLRDLVSRTNVYINTRGTDLDIGAVVMVTRWVGQMLRMFGLGEGETSEIGWGQDRDAAEGGINVRPLFAFALRPRWRYPWLMAVIAARRGSHALSPHTIYIP